MDDKKLYDPNHPDVTFADKVKPIDVKMNSLVKKTTGFLNICNFGTSILNLHSSITSTKLRLKEESQPTSIDDFLLIEMSRRNTDMVADLVMQKPALFDELFKAYLRNEEPVSRRAAWVVDLVTEKFPELLCPHLHQILSMLPKFRHDGLKRHSLRMLARSPLPDGDELGKLITICFEWLLSPREAVAAKIYCMDLLFRISRIEPDLKNELADSIEYRMPEETAGFKNRGQKMLNKLYSELNSP